MKHKFCATWIRTVLEEVTATVEAVSTEEALNILKKGKGGFEIYDTLTLEVLENRKPKVKLIKKGSK